MRLSVRVVGGIVLAGLSGEATPVHAGARSQEANRRDLIGCFSLYEADGRRIDRRSYNAHPAVRLDSSPWNPGEETEPRAQRWRLEGLDSTGAPESRARNRGRRSPSWHVGGPGDSLRLSFVDGFSGAVFVFAAPRPAPDTLRGRMFQSWDFDPSETGHREVYAVRFACR